MNGLITGASLFLSVCLVFGAPLVEPASVASLLLVGFTLILFEPTRCWRRRAVAGGVIVLAAIAGLFLAAPKVVERHQAFVPVTPEARAHLATLLGETLTAEFTTLLTTRFPVPGSCSDLRACWYEGQGPATPFAFSADDPFAWPEASRRFSAMQYRSLSEFRAGFLNLRKYNWYDTRSDLTRSNMPVVAVFTPQEGFDGGRFCAAGRVFHIPAGVGREGNLAPISSGQCITVAAGDTIVHARILPEDAFVGRWIPPQGWLINAQRMIGFAAILAATLLLRGRMRASAGFGAAALATGLIVAVMHPVAPLSFAPLHGGNDGLTYVSFAQAMLQAAYEGDIIEALRGGTDVFYFQPGYRYVRAVEMAIFGNSLVGSTFGMLGLTLAAAFAGRLVASVWGGWAILGLIAISIVTVAIIDPLAAFGLGFYTHLKLTYLGFAETTALSLWLFGLTGVVLALRGQARHGLAAGGAAFMALAMTMRSDVAPGLLVFAMASILLVMIRRDWTLCLALASGFAVATLPLLHNLFYGGAFVPITSTRTLHLLIGLSPDIWVSALRQLPSPSPEALEIWTYLRLSFEGAGKAVFIVLSLLIALGFGLGRRDFPEIRIMAITGIVGLAPTLLVYWDATGDRRYEMIGAATCMIAVLAWASTIIRRHPAVAFAFQALWAAFSPFPRSRGEATQDERKPAPG